MQSFIHASASDAHPPVGNRGGGDIVKPLCQLLRGWCEGKHADLDPAGPDVAGSLELTVKHGLRLTAMAMGRLTRSDQLLANLRQSGFDFIVRRLADGEAVVEQQMAGFEDALREDVEVCDEALVIQLVRLERDLEQPRVAVQRDAGPEMPSDVVTEVNVNTGSDGVHAKRLRRGSVIALGSRAANAPPLLDHVAGDGLLGLDILHQCPHVVLTRGANDLE